MHNGAYNTRRIDGRHFFELFSPPGKALQSISGRLRTDLANSRRCSMIVPPVATSEAGATVSFQLEPRATNLPPVFVQDTGCGFSRPTTGPVMSVTSFVWNQGRTSLFGTRI
jgi:hypothetical protein